MADILQTAFVVSVLGGMIRMATPLAFGALGELVTQRAGIMNLGIEGMMLAGAFTGFLAAHTTGSLSVGVAMGILAAGVLGLLMAFMSATLRVDQIVSGLAINLLATGMTFYLFRVGFRHVGAENLPTITTFSIIQVPLLSQLPIVGQSVFSQHALAYVAIAFAPAIWFFLYRTRYGLELRLMGENPRALDMRGISVVFRQYAAVLFGSMMAGAGGVFLTLAWAGLFTPQISAGRGFIAFALVIFGNWSPGRILVGALFFGLIDALQLQLQAIGVGVPHQLLLSLPYILTILALLTSRARSREPEALGVPYLRES